MVYLGSKGGLGYGVLDGMTIFVVPNNTCFDDEGGMDG